MVPHRGPAVELPSNAVPHELLHHPELSLIRNRVNRGAYFADRRTRSADIDRGFQGILGL